MRNVILIGQSGQGKSYISNLLTSDDYFPEYDGGEQKKYLYTNDVRSEMEIEGEKYRIIEVNLKGDYFGREEDFEKDKKLALKELSKFFNQFSREKINRILFIVKFGRLTSWITRFRDIFQFLDPNIERHISIICNKASKQFKDEEACRSYDEENRRLIKENNPTIYICDEDRLDEEDKLRMRERLIEHLKECDTFYDPTNLLETTTNNLKKGYQKFYVFLVIVAIVVVISFVIRLYKKKIKYKHYSHP